MKRVVWDRIMGELYSNSVWTDDLLLTVEEEDVLVVPVELVVKLLYEECPPEASK